jgi:hypothetical protein
MYQPFLHYVSQEFEGKNVDKRSYACAAACVSVSRNIVHITAEMKRRGLLIGSYWFVMYTSYFAIVSLAFFVFENPRSPTGNDIMHEATEGRDMLASLSGRSFAADRCTQSLKVQTISFVSHWYTTDLGRCYLPNYKSTSRRVGINHSLCRPRTHAQIRGMIWPCRRTSRVCPIWHDLRSTFHLARQFEQVGSPMQTWRQTAGSLGLSPTPPVPVLLSTTVPIFSRSSGVRGHRPQLQTQN